MTQHYLLFYFLLIICHLNQLWATDIEENEIIVFSLFFNEITLATSTETNVSEIAIELSFLENETVIKSSQEWQLSSEIGLFLASFSGLESNTSYFASFKNIFSEKIIKNIEKSFFI